MRSLALGLGVLLLGLVSCQPSVGGDGIPGSAQATPTGITPTATVRPTASASGPSTSPSATPSPTPRATLSVEERSEQVRLLLATNGGCRLPCWWGVNPGQTTWHTATQLLSLPSERLIDNADRSLGHSGITVDMPHPARLFDYRVHVNFTDRNEIVQLIGVDAEVFRSSASDTFSREWQAYALDRILSQYRVPSQVLVGLHPAVEAGAQSEYSLVVVYETLGILLRYSGPARPVANNGDLVLRACLDFSEVTSLDLRLQSRQWDKPLLEALLGSDELPYYRPLEAATGMSLVDFSRTFSSAAPGECLEGAPTMP